MKISEKNEVIELLKTLSTQGKEKTEAIDAKLDNIYNNFKDNLITNEKAIQALIDYYTYFEYKTEIYHYRTDIEKIVEKIINYIIEINPTSKKVFEFLESVIIDNTIDIKLRHSAYNLIGEYFPKKHNKIKQYLLYNDHTYFPCREYIFGGKKIKGTGLEDFLFKTYNILSSYLPSYYDPFSYDSKLNGFSNSNCAIIHKKYKPFKYKQYIKKYPFSKRNTFSEIDPILSYEKGNRRYYKKVIKGYYINNKYFVRKHLLSLAIKLFKEYNNMVNYKNLFIYLPKNIKNPIKIIHDKTDIIIYIFSEELTKNSNNLKSSKETVKIVNRFLPTKISGQQKMILKLLNKGFHNPSYYDLNKRLFSIINSNNQSKDSHNTLPNSYRASFSRSIKRLKNRSLIEYFDNKIRLTEKGRTFCTELF